MSAHSSSHEHAEDHAHPTPKLYAMVGLVLFLLTFFEVAAYEIGHRPDAILHGVIEPLVVPILLVLSAAKFALVAMFYMHLKQDSKLFSNLFVWPLVIAAAVILSLIVLHEYWIKSTF